MIIQAIIFIIVGIIITQVFGKLRGTILKGLGGLFKDLIPEKFSKRKFAEGMLNIANPVEWAKDIVSILNLRKIIVYLSIVGIIFSYGKYQGMLGKPVEVNLSYDKEFNLKLDGHYLHKPKNSQNLEIIDKDGNIIKNIKAKDFPELAKALRPYGIIFKPVGIIGVGASSDSRGFEGGAGISFIKYWAWRIEIFLTNKGAYLGTSYKLPWKLTKNSYLGAGYGKGWLGDNRGIFYYKWDF